MHMKVTVFGATGPVATDATRGILHAIEAADVRRFVAVSSPPSMTPPPSSNRSESPTDLGRLR